MKSKWQHNGLYWLVVLSVLNMIDAISTAILISSNRATELNPIMNYAIVHFGMPGFFIFKFLMVSGVSIVLYLLRPKSIWAVLRIMSALYTLVLLWHIVVWCTLP